MRPRLHARAGLRHRRHDVDHGRSTRWPQIGPICREHGVWLHVDAAYAGVSGVVPELRRLQDGVEWADSYTTDAHKWLLTGFDATLFWVADRAALTGALAILPEYLRNAATDAGAVVDYRDWQIQLGRRFRALKLWFVLRWYGAEGLRAHIRSHVALAQELAGWAAADERFDVVAPHPLSLVCLRPALGRRRGRRRRHHDPARAAQRRRRGLPDPHDGRRVGRAARGRRRAATTRAHVERVWTLLRENHDWLANDFAEQAAERAREAAARAEEQARRRGRAGRRGRRAAERPSDPEHARRAPAAPGRRRRAAPDETPAPGRRDRCPGRRPGGRQRPRSRRPSSAEPPGSALQVPDEPLLRDRGDVGAVGRPDLAEAERPAGRRRGAVGLVEEPLVGAHRRVEPHRVVQARARRSGRPSRRRARARPAESSVRSLAKVSAAVCTAGSSGSRPATRIQTRVCRLRRLLGLGREGVLEQPLLERQADQLGAGRDLRVPVGVVLQRRQRLGRRDVGHGQRVLHHGPLPRREVGGEREDSHLLAAPVLVREHPPGAERPAVADALDRVADLLLRIPRPQEVRVQRVHPAVGRHGPAGRHQRLTRDLAAEDALQRRVRGLADEDVRRSRSSRSSTTISAAA